MSDPHVKIDASELRALIRVFLEIDKMSVEDFNNALSYQGRSIERQISFLSWRLLHAIDFLVKLSDTLAEYIESHE